MGMDIYGRDPQSIVGHYYRASIWAWRPLHAAMVHWCGDLLGDKLIEAMTFNDGAGPSDQAVCDKLALRLEAVLQSEQSGFRCDSSLKVDADGRLLSANEVADRNPDEIDTPYRIDADEVRDWINFLRHCGGFSVC